MRQYCDGARAEDRRRLAPLALQPVERRRQDQDHQRDLEVEIGDRQAPEAQEVEAERAEVDAEVLHRAATVTRPAGPRVARKAKASGMPAKLRGDAAEGQ